jgi:hypothetical protein
MNMTVIPEEESALHFGANLKIILTHEDLTEETAATAQVIEAISVAVGDLVDVVDVVLEEAFEDSTDPANNSTSLIVGEGAIARFLSAMEVNANGTTAWKKAGTGTRLCFAAADTVDATFGAPPAGKTLAAFDKGRVAIYVRKVA